MENKNLPIIFILIGLPCRGKSYWSKHLKSFLETHNKEIKIFNLGEFRRVSQTQNEDKN